MVLSAKGIQAGSCSAFIGDSLAVFDHFFWVLWIL